MHMKKVLMIGSTVADISIRVDHLPSLEEDVNPFGQSISLGGCCFNVSNMLALYNVPYTLFSPVGTGLYGSFIKQSLRERGMEPFLLSDEENGCCYCIVDKDGNRTFLAVHGAEYRFKPEWFERIDATDYSDVYVCGLEVEEDSGVYIIDYLQKHPELRVWFAPSARILNVQPERMDALLACHPILHLNRHEASSWLRGKDALPDADTMESLVHALYEFTSNTVFMTDGANGACAFDGTNYYYEPAVRTEVTDGTGAGDCHAGTLIACTKIGMPISDALHEANRNAAAVVSVQGALFSKERFQDLQGR